MTLQTNTAVIGAALLAIAAGAWSGGRAADRVADPLRLIGPMLLAGAALTLLTLPAVRYVGQATKDTGDASATLLLAMAAVILPAGLLSAVAPVVAKLQLRDLHETGTIVGKLSGIGTLGGIVATFATGFVLVAAFATSTILIATAVVVSLVGALVLGYERQRTGRWGGGAGRLPGAAAALLPVALLLVVVAPNPCQKETEYHCARVVADPDRPGGRTLELDTLRHSYVDLTDPEYLEFDYTKAIASVADAVRPAGAPMQALHIGGGGFTLPRYLAATRPGTRSTVLEIDGGVVALGRQELGVDAIPGLAVRVGDARTGLREQPRGRFDLVVGDAFGGLAVPWHLTTREVAEQVRDVLTGDGGVRGERHRLPAGPVRPGRGGDAAVGVRARGAARRAGHGGRRGRRQPHPGRVPAAAAAGRHPGPAGRAHPMGRRRRAGHRRVRRPGAGPHRRARPGGPADHHLQPVSQPVREMSTSSSSAGSARRSLRRARW